MAGVRDPCNFERAGPGPGLAAAGSVDATVHPMASPTAPVRAHNRADLMTLLQRKDCVGRPARVGMFWTLTMSAAKNNQHMVPAITYVKKMRDYSKEPFFMKKLEDMMDFLEKAGLPDGSKFKRPKKRKK